MSTVPTKRLLVYVVAGLVVLAVGAGGLVWSRGGGGGDPSAIVISGAPAASTSPGATTGGTASGSTSPGGPEAAPALTTTTTEVLIYVQVAGEVRRPGVYRVAPDARVFEAVLEAGGFTEQADQQTVPLAARLSDGCKVVVPKVGAAAAGPVVSSDPLGGSATGSTAGVVSLNSATLQQLDSLPGIGPALAQQIITYREANGPFTSVDQLNDVPGIGPSKFAQLRPLVGL